ncbi:MAG: hypothetical protein ACK5KQ_02930 [Anaerorhabdus sp.]
MLQINEMKNFYGIKELKLGNQNEFKKINLIFAPNGTFKTSFYKGFENIQENREQEIKDRITNIPASYDIKFNNNSISNNDVITFNTAIINDIENFDSFNILINKEIQNDMKRIQQFLKEMDKLNIPTDLLDENLNSFEQYISLTDVTGEDEYKKFQSEYSKIKEEKVMGKFDFYKLDKSGILTSATQANIKNIMDLKKVEEDLLRGELGINDVESGLELLGKIYSVGHELKVKKKDSSYIELKSFNEFKEFYESEKKAIEENILKTSTDYTKLYKTLDNNNDNRELKKYIEENISKIDKFTYPKKYYFLYENYNVFNKYDTEELNKSLDKIKEYSQKYNVEYFKESVEKFNERFFDYIKLDLEESRSELGFLSPKIVVNFYENDIDSSALLNIASRGEKSAISLFLLLHTVEKISSDDKLIMIDDELEVFDYASKHSFIEYLNEIAKKDNIKMVILSHNFDFLRTLSSRLEIDRNEVQRMSAYKNENQVVELNKIKNLDEMKLENKFKKITEKNLITFIATKRNIEGFEQKKDNFNKLTYYLHFKEDTKNKTLGDLQNFIVDNSPKVEWGIPETKNYLVYLEERSEKIITDRRGCSNLNLDDKMTLAVACRMKFEEKFIDVEKEYLSNQTRLIFNDLSKELKKQFGEINIIIPDFVHLNSFAYEPLMDIKIDRLINLYNKLKEYKN